MRLLLSYVISHERECSVPPVTYLSQTTMSGCISLNHKILEHLKLEGTHKNHRIQLLAPQSTVQISGYISESPVQMFTELWNAECLEHCPGEPVPCPPPQ